MNNIVVILKPQDQGLTSTDSLQNGLKIWN